MKLICWVNHKLGKSQKILDALKQAGFTGLIINVQEEIIMGGQRLLCDRYDDITKANLKDFPDSLLSLGTGMWRGRQKLYPEIKKFYLDEPCTTKYNGVDCWDSNEVTMQLGFNGSKNYLFGEPSILVLENYRHIQCGITFSSYRKYWVWLEKLTGWRIPRYGNQISFWNELEYVTDYRLNTFTNCWINLQLNKNHFPELIKWCKEHQKTIMLYVEWDVTEEQFLRELPEFTKIYKSIYEIS